MKDFLLALIMALLAVAAVAFVAFALLASFGPVHRTEEPLSSNPKEDISAVKLCGCFEYPMSYGVLS